MQNAKRKSHDDDTLSKVKVNFKKKRFIPTQSKQRNKTS